MIRPVGIKKPKEREETYFLDTESFYYQVFFNGRYAQVCITDKRNTTFWDLDSAGKMKERNIKDEVGFKTIGPALQAVLNHYRAHDPFFNQVKVRWANEIIARIKDHAYYTTLKQRARRDNRCYSYEACYAHAEAVLDQAEKEFVPEAKLRSAAFQAKIAREARAYITLAINNRAKGADIYDILTAALLYSVNSGEGELKEYQPQFYLNPERSPLGLPL